MHPLIFTDLDSSLLNHGDYSFDDALPSLERIKQRRIPLIFTTSKTRKEIEIIQEKMGIRDPYIVENGGGIYFSHEYDRFELGDAARKDGHYVIELGTPYAEIRKFVEQAGGRFEIRGFGDMTVREVARMANLPLQDAMLAKAREYTEPFMVRDAYLHEIAESSVQAGLKITKGGRFYHFLGMQQDKGRAVEIVRDIFRENGHGRVLTVGVGDSMNDLPMLRSVDIPILIPHPDGSYEKIDLPNLVQARHPGSRGWNEVMMQVIDLLDEESLQ